MNRVIVGLSGGVDSSVAALILKKKGYEVIGIYLKNNYKNSFCDWEEESISALMVSQQLGIPFYIFDITNYYKKIIFDYTINEYIGGKTPNPDVLCNNKIKFNILIKKSGILKADYIATGHYVRKKKNCIAGKTMFKLFTALDNKKDQSYFLCNLNQNQIKKSLFPLGKLNKENVRKIAESSQLINAKRKDSQGICFLGKINLSTVIKNKRNNKLGKIILINKNCKVYKKKILYGRSTIEKLYILSQKIKYRPKYGQIIGYHKGVYYFTKGQRKGLKIGGLSQPIFVIEKDLKQNILYVGLGNHHPGLFNYVIFIKKENITWIYTKYKNLISKKNPFKVKSKIRSRQRFKMASLYNIKQGIYIYFHSPQRALSEGQYIVLYFRNELICSCLYT
ncbi:tRNA 2-thiouridine(34) synthase MnmA [Candidatus Karelsulcia muelleri]|uniref:tRNA 2-thiouridine(34) synthase MnmA n=1 Tax=Candidatus Karelsulcia muelleri TaxID=336810 RepID=UPI00194E948C|nr:tRNA 2-thiouridine(34) synthase MnmA [Candidatus Karelsulcia muelleri]